jgi:phospholipase/carboxylesterase/glyoxalase family protein
MADDFIHVYEPPSAADGTILLLLHGTGGNEQDLLSLAEVLAPEAGVLSPRGKVLERGMPRFFRRLAEGVFDIDDLKFRTGELADFLLASATRYRFDVRQLIAVGFSNGANIAGSTLLLRPDALTAGILFRAMVPLVPEPRPALTGSRVLVSNGTQDPLVTAAETERLVTLFRDSGAAADLVWQDAGHQLAQGDVTAARQWLGAAVSSKRSG